ncbi:MAG: 50S ribosomal protein L21e [Candidatus Pacearchaeota archaeon]
MKRKHKNIREKGKIKLSRMFQNLKVGDKVSIVREMSEKAGFPKRVQGKSGVIEGKRGNAYIVKVFDLNREKKYIIKPIHLKKLESINIEKIEHLK